MINLTINQHYIPKCILLNFCNHKQQVFECFLNNRKIYPTNIKSSMMYRFTYEHPYFEKNKIENWFSKIESYMGPAIREIILSIENFESGNGEFNLIRESVVNHLREFITFYYRSGALLYEYSFGRKSKDDNILIMLNKIMNTQYLTELSKSIANNYNFTILNSPDGNFLLSDQYISTAALGIKNKFFNISNRHMGLKETLILIPLSKNYYILFYHGKIPKFISKNSVNKLSEKLIEKFNDVIINNSYFKCVSFSKLPLIKSLEKYKQDFPREVFGGLDNGLTFGATLKKEIFFYERDQKAWELLYLLKKWKMYDKVNRNDLCPCGSSQKFKKCCLEPLDIANKIIKPFVSKNHFPFAYVDKNSDIININAIIEQPVEEFINNIKNS